MSNQTSEINAELQPISVRDAASMFRKPITPNLPPYTAAAIKYNNQLVSQWKTEVLDELADTNGNIQCGRVGKSWGIMYEADLTEKFMRYSHVFPRVNDECLKEIVEILSQPIEELWALGFGCVSLLHQSLDTEIRIRISENKYHEFFSKFRNPLERDRKAAEFNNILNPSTLPLDISPETLKDITEKVKHLAKINPQAIINKLHPTDIKSIPHFRHAIPPNCPPYAKKIMELDNELIEVWSTDILFATHSQMPNLHQNFFLFLEGRQTRSLIDNIRLIPDTSDALLELFTAPIETVVNEFGAGVIGMGWSFVKHRILLDLARNKYKVVFTTDNPKDWVRLAKEYPDIVNPIDLPIWGNDVYLDCEQKWKSVVNSRIIDPVY